MSKEKPILFSTPMVQAILDGRKTMTRRVIEFPTPKYQPGDILWVRETWCPCATINGWLDDVSLYGYKADCDKVVPWKWKPSIHMPRAAARIFLRVTDVRVEKLQDMPLFDVWDEGTPQMPGNLHSDGAVNQWDFRYLWDSLNAKRGFGWDVNPWVWVYSFERVDKPAGWPGGDKGAEQ